MKTIYQIFSSLARTEYLEIGIHSTTNVKSWAIEEWMSLQFLNTISEDLWLDEVHRCTIKLVPEIGWHRLGFVVWLTSWLPARFTKIIDEQQVIDKVHQSISTLYWVSAGVLTTKGKGIGQPTFRKGHRHATPIAEYEGTLLVRCSLV